MSADLPVIPGYVIDGLVGEGGMGRVYRATTVNGGQRVAIKILRVDRVAADQREAMRTRFRRETRALARLRHPHILRILDVGTLDGQPYLVTDFLPGGSLREQMGTAWAWPRAVRFVRQIAQALVHAHAQGVIHRDVKPANVLLSADGLPVLGDFGVARILQNDATPGQVTLSLTGVGIGTPEYMAPEQALGRPVDARADVYALGVLLFELITGRRPFASDTPMGVVLGHLNEPPPSPRQWAPDLPVALERLILTALAKRPTDRYPSVAALLAALEGSAPLVRTRLAWAAWTIAGVWLSLVAVVAWLRPPGSDASGVEAGGAEIMGTGALTPESRGPTATGAVPGVDGTPAPAKGVAVSGHVWWSGTPLADASVHLQPLFATAPGFTVTTSAQGVYAWPAVPEGHYAREISAPGYETATDRLWIDATTAHLPDQRLARQALTVTTIQRRSAGDRVWLHVVWRALMGTGGGLLYDVAVRRPTDVDEVHSGWLINVTMADLDMSTLPEGPLRITVRAWMPFESNGDPVWVLLAEGTYQWASDGTVTP